MDSIIKIFLDNFGYAYLKDLKTHKIHSDTIRRMIDEGKIEKIKAGLYKLSDMPLKSNQVMIDINMAMPKAVVCLHSALAYYELTTAVPDRIMVALSRTEKPARFTYPPTQVFYFSINNYETGKKVVKTLNGNFQIYSNEKTIVDCFRYRNKLGKDVAIEGLRNYFDNKNYDVNKLINFAKQGRMFKVMNPYVESFLNR